MSGPFFFFFFEPLIILGGFIGCFLANLLSGSIPVDIIFGSIATLIGAIATHYAGRLKNKSSKWLAPAGPILSNTIIVPFVLKYGYGTPQAIPYMMFTIALSEIIVCGILGMMLFNVINRYKTVFFSCISSFHTTTVVWINTHYHSSVKMSTLRE